MALKLSLDPQGVRIVDNITNFIETRHNSGGKEDIVPLYIFNDGKRYGMTNDENPPELIYENIVISFEGVQHRLQQAVSSSTGAVTLEFDTTEGWNIGTVITANGERMRIEQLQSNGTVIVVKRNYQDGGSSINSSHGVNDVFVSETKSASLAPPSTENYDSPAQFLGGGVSYSGGFDPTYLAQAIDARPTTNVIRSTSGAKYHPKSVILVGNKERSEIMRIDSIKGDELTVTRGFKGTTPVQHSANTQIMCIGLTDVMVGNNSNYSHKFFLKVQPPTGLPTQKKKDIILNINADESAL